MCASYRAYKERPEFVSQPATQIPWHQIRDSVRDERSIGLILCKSRDRLTVEYSLYNTTTPIGISAYRLADALPDEFKGNLPSIEELEAELASLPDLEEESES